MLVFIRTTYGGQPEAVFDSYADATAIPRVKVKGQWPTYHLYNDNGYLGGVIEMRVQMEPQEFTNKSPLDKEKPNVGD